MEGADLVTGVSASTNVRFSVKPSKRVYHFISFVSEW